MTINKVLSLIKRKYCEDLFIRPGAEMDAVAFQHVTTNQKGNAVFEVTHPGEPAHYWELVRIDLAYLSDNRALSIPKQYRNDFDVNHCKAMLVNWINRYTGINLLEEDVSYLVPEPGHITVVIAPDSMRFTSTSFKLIRL